jgi:apolipoprotein D and lipocalin family protein
MSMKAKLPPMKLVVAAGGALAMLAGVGPVPAKAPQPVRPVAPSLYSGRWYQVAQIAKNDQHFCAGATDDFSPDGRGGLSGVATCHEGNPSGKAHQYKAKVSIVAGSRDAKFKMSFFGGLWLIARQPNLDPKVRQAAVIRIAALGYDVSKLKPAR